MSNISDEQLVVAAARGDTNVMENIKERAIFGKYGIRKCLKKMGSTDKEISLLEPKIVQILLASIPKYEFTAPFFVYGYNLAVNYSLRYKENREVPLFDKEIHKEKACPNTLRTLSDTLGKPKHPPLGQIDLEIRTLVSLLNQSPDIKTSGSSCSGHPDQEEWKNSDWSQFGGYIGIIPMSSPDKALDFLNGILKKLDNSNTQTKNGFLPAELQQTKSALNENITFTDAIRARYKQVDAEDLFCSDAPVVLINVSFRFYVCHSHAKHSLEIWKQLIARIKELIPEDRELTAEVDTPEKAMQLLQKALHRLPFLFSATLTTSQEGYPGIVLTTVADLALLQWFSTLADRLHECLDDAGYVSSPDAEDDIPFAEKWTFTLRPFLNQECIPLLHLLTPQWEPRTREDHLKIWKLLELAVAEQVECEV